jgi:hypothetical protein
VLVPVDEDVDDVPVDVDVDDVPVDVDVDDVPVDVDDVPTVEDVDDAEEVDEDFVLDDLLLVLVLVLLGLDSSNRTTIPRIMISTNPPIHRSMNNAILLTMITVNYTHFINDTTVCERYTRHSYHATLIESFDARQIRQIPDPVLDPDPLLDRYLTPHSLISHRRTVGCARG